MKNRVRYHSQYSLGIPPLDFFMKMASTVQHLNRVLFPVLSFLAFGALIGLVSAGDANAGTPGEDSPSYYCEARCVLVFMDPLEGPQLLRDAGSASGEGKTRREAYQALLLDCGGTLKDRHPPVEPGEVYQSFAIATDELTGFKYLRDIVDATPGRVCSSFN